jgi:NIMA-interacting peptidyl-prolyl cis-trans isomerase 1
VLTFALWCGVVWWCGGQETVRARHILVKHRDSRRPSSWREPDITRSLEEAKAIISGQLSGSFVLSLPKQMHDSLFFLVCFFCFMCVFAGYREQLLTQKAKFEDLAREFSDCSSHSRDGDLGRFARGKMQKPFEDAAYECSALNAYAWRCGV